MSNLITFSDTCSFFPMYSYTCIAFSFYNLVLRTFLSLVIVSVASVLFLNTFNVVLLLLSMACIQTRTGQILIPTGR